MSLTTKNVTASAHPGKPLTFLVSWAAEIMHIVFRWVLRCTTRTQWALLALGLHFASSAGAQSYYMGLREWPPAEENGALTLFYPTQQAEQSLQRGPFELHAALNAPIQYSNGRLVLISHGSGGNPWVSSDLARTLIQAGFIVAVPEHAGDSTRDFSAPGPDSWAKRPEEISRALDRISNDPDLKPLIDSHRVGVYGGSAGGHTALTLAGGRWSAARFLAHCEAHLKQDFSSCVGFTTRLQGNWLDTPKQWLALQVLRHRFTNPQTHAHEDARIVAAVAEVPFAADFDMNSLRQPRIPLGLVLAGQDVNQVPRFHGQAVRAACSTCETIADLPQAGHGMMLSPLPPLGAQDSLARELLGDPPGFDRQRELPAVHRAITQFFIRHLAVHTP